MKHGYAPFLPHLSHYWNLVSKHSWGEWLEYDEAWVEVCDAVIRLPGHSPGADREVAYAVARNIPVFYTVAELNQWRLDNMEALCYQDTTSTVIPVPGPATSSDTPPDIGCVGSTCMLTPTPTT